MRVGIPRLVAILSCVWLLVGCTDPHPLEGLVPDFASRLFSAPSRVVSASKAKAQSRAGASAPVLPSVTTSVTKAALSAVDQHAPAPSAEPVDGFLGEPDEPVIDVLRTAPVTFVEKGRGGRSLGFRITLEGGQRGYFKAEQTFSAANWDGEVAAYHLDRMLGLGRVPPVTCRVLPWSALVSHAGRDPRKNEVIVRDGLVRGAFVGWVNGSLRPLLHHEGWERWVRVKYWPSTAVSPFQRPAVWKRELDQQRLKGDEFRTKEERLRRRNLRPEPDRPDRAAELSDLLVFDYLTRNLDRWGGDNANVLVRGDAGPLIFLDNAAGFEPGEARPSLMEARLHVIQRFRRRTIEAVRAFDLKKFEARLAEEPVQPVLKPDQLAGLEARRMALLDWVNDMQKAYGEAVWAWD